MCPPKVYVPTGDDALRPDGNAPVWCVMRLSKKYPGFAFCLCGSSTKYNGGTTSNLNKHAEACPSAMAKFKEAKEKAQTQQLKASDSQPTLKDAVELSESQQKTIERALTTALIVR